MIIETATLEDAEEILNLQHLAYLSEAEIYDDYSLAPLAQTLENSKRNSTITCFSQPSFTNGL